jgi:hypothetical protein
MSRSVLQTLLTGKTPGRLLLLEASVARRSKSPRQTLQLCPGINRFETLKDTLTLYFGLVGSDSIVEALPLVLLLWEIGSRICCALLDTLIHFLLII